MRQSNDSKMSTQELRREIKREFSSKHREDSETKKQNLEQAKDILNRENQELKCKISRLEEKVKQYKLEKVRELEISQVSKKFTRQRSEKAASQEKRLENENKEGDSEILKSTMKRIPAELINIKSLDDTLSRIGSEDERPDTQLSSDKQLYERIRKLEQVILSKKNKAK